MKRKPAKATTEDDTCPLQPGYVIVFLYPKHPFVGVRGPLEPHFGRVLCVRDLQSEPPTKIDIKLNPTLVRSRFAVDCVSPGTGAKSTFFTDYMQHLKLLPSDLFDSQILPRAGTLVPFL